MTKIILTRHGHVEGIEPERFRGRIDVPLTELGRAQARAVAAGIAEIWKPAIVYTSPMSRCVATGQEIAWACGIASEVLEDLNDLDYGRWHWQTHDEVRATWPDLLATWYATPHLLRFPDGDSLQDLVARTADALRFCARASSIGDSRAGRASQRQSSPARAASRSTSFGVLADCSVAVRDQRDRCC